MIGALIILVALVGVGLVLYLFHRRDVRRGEAQAPTRGPMTDVPPGEDGEVCCGMHATCEKDSLLAAVSEKIEYFDDYPPEEVEEFRDVLLTLIESDVAPWARSLQLRGINLPTDVRDELLLLVAEKRNGTPGL